MKKSARFIFLALILLLTVALLAACASDSTNNGDSGNGGGDGQPTSPPAFKLESRAVTGGVEVFSSTPKALDATITIPATINGQPVVGIAENAFKGFSNLKQVIIEEGADIQYIHARAFDNCASLESFIVPDTCTTIGKYAFAACPKLEYLYIPTSVDQVGDYIVKACDTQNLDVYCGYGAKPNGWSGYYASNKEHNSGVHFDFWWGITEMQLKDPDFECGVKLDGTLLLADYNGKATDVTVPTSIDLMTVGEIASNCFIDNKTLRTIILPETVESIGKRAFKGCTQLQYVELPTGLKRIDSYAFDSCTALQYVTIPNTVDEMGALIFAGCKTNVLDIYCQAATKPSGWNGQYGSNDTGSYSVHFDFWWGTTDVELSDEKYEAGVKLDGTLIITHYLGKETSVTIPDKIGDKTVSEIGNYAFYECSTFNSISLPSGLKRIGYKAFAKCVLLTSVSLPAGVEFIDSRAFSDNTALERVFIPDSVTTVGEFLFIGCKRTALKIYCGAAAKPNGWNTCYGSNDTGSIGVHFDFIWGSTN
ncbi:MAG: leucine-rich repeat domain-containing protein [Clostridia bacterium]|nr:leucine-rich repeat domain-containing protein [Clostridia bacterium]